MRHGSNDLEFRNATYPHLALVCGIEAWVVGGALEGDSVRGPLGSNLIQV